MGNTAFILIDKKEKKVRMDADDLCLLIFDSLTDARRYLKRVVIKEDRENTEIVERIIEFKKTEQGNDT